MFNIFDLHNDYFIEITSEKQKAKYLSAQNKNGLKKLCSAVWTTKMNEETAFYSIEKCKKFAEEHNLYHSIEDLHFINETNIGKLIKLKPIYAGLTWNEENNIAGGALSYSGITKWGKDVIKILEDNNIQIDTAHLNEKSFLEFSSMTNKPILCSHTAMHTKCDNPRNLKDYQLKIIAENGGLIGLCLVSHFLNSEKPATVNDIALHIDYYVSKYGIETIALGTDFYGTTNYPKGIKSYKDIIKLQNRLESLGYSKHSIEKIFYLNAEKFFSSYY